MTLIDPVPREVLRQRPVLRGCAAENTKDAFVHSISRRLLEAGALGLEEIA
jgi:CHASE2 domain-containing sensor protein